jgi:hypothetical protein
VFAVDVATDGDPTAYDEVVEMDEVVPRLVDRVPVEADPTLEVVG